MLPASGCTTASAKPTATAASTALPPARRMSRPTWLAIVLPETTTALSASVTMALPANFQPSATPEGWGPAQAGRQSSSATAEW